MRFLRAITRGISTGYNQIPYLAEQGICISITGILFDGAGNFWLAFAEVTKVSLEIVIAFVGVAGGLREDQYWLTLRFSHFKKARL
jgi:hypothetical protein